LEFREQERVENFASSFFHLNLLAFMFMQSSGAILPIFIGKTIRDSPSTEMPKHSHQSLERRRNTAASL
jgi:hypothetical protein